MRRLCCSILPLLLFAFTLPGMAQTVTGAVRGTITDPSGAIVSGGIVEQTEQVLKNVSAVLAAAGTSLDKVIKSTVFLKDMDDFAKMNEVYARYLSGNGKIAPARSTVEVSRLPKDSLVEIEVIALL